MRRVHTLTSKSTASPRTQSKTPQKPSSHREEGFIDDVYRRYIEYYGVLQAVYMQQDAIEALFNLLMIPEKIDFAALPNWQKLRDLRNNTVGHPVGRRKRLNRNGIAYGCVNYQWCPNVKVSSWKSTDVNLSALLDAYDSEAAGLLDSVFRRLETECATKHNQQDKSGVLNFNS